MNTLQQQRGMTLWSFIFMIGLLAFVVFTALKVVPVYMEDFSVESSVKGMEEVSGADYRGAINVRGGLLKRLDINNVTQVKPDDISVIRDGAHYQMDVDYVVTIPYLGNISLVIKFHHSALVPAGT